MQGISRRTFHRLLGAGACATACSGGSTLALYNWGDYLAPEVLERFTAATGVRVTQDYYLAEAELVAKLASGGAYDVVFPIDYVLERMRKQALVVPLARDKLPGLANLDPQFGPWIAADNQIYAVPYLWGTTGIGYDSDRVDPPKSWKALFDPQYAGKLSVIDSKGDVFDQALLAAGMDINSTDKPAIRERVYPLLRAQKDLLRAYDSNPARALVSGETWIAQIDSGDLFRAQKQRPSLRYVIPDEGAVLWIDYLAIPATAPLPGVAVRFLEFLLDPEVAAINANALRFATPNLAALQRGLVADAADPALYPSAETRKKLFVSENWFGQTEAVVDELWLELRRA
ncbi:polyamine ABC transporter substrate-binding protein [Nannocystis punicea]|uniref:Spermidine/putrescine ABC transporter substrate-binding protein n=1 Tax=Nannocystis punicea TaxID=2995304 RepID=A0ABY7GVM9_9BACT|nr:spermidine/putrescine ABC transporter substrate-binding protein [Nannocystis poenicansa]WAS91011.1 spermidine/putrescine ABC transporter substrate-binding protein [Nannocystis poenicansa]